MLPVSPHGELQRLLADLTEGLLNPEESATLTAILRTDPSARAFYHEYIEMHSLLQWHHASPLHGPALDPRDCAPEDYPIFHGHRGEAMADKNGTVPFHADFLGNGMHGTVGYFSSGWPVAYLVATVVLGLGLLIGNVMHVSQSVQVVHKSVPLPSPSGRGAGGEGNGSGNSPLPSSVGRITGIVDCKWSEVGWVKRSAAPPAGGRGEKSSVATNLPSPASGRGAGDEGRVQLRSPVSLGDKFALASGLIEITYNTGARVILQGPCTYEVESTAGGYLSVGKLTARVEKKNNSPLPSDGRGAGGEGGEKTGNRNESQNALTLALSQGERGPDSRSSFLIPHSYFAVRTPTATVTDLGTEFGVEVDSQGTSHVETFVGLVEVALTTGSQSNRSQALAAGEAVRVDASGSMATAPLKTIHFVRGLRRETLGLYAKTVLEDRPLAYWPLSETPNARRIVDHSKNGSGGRLVGAIRLGQRGPLSSDRSRAAEFTGDGYIEVNQLPNTDPTKGFSIEAWARVDGEIMQNGQRECRSVIMYRDLNEGSNSKGFYLYAGSTDTWDFWTGINNAERSGDVWDLVSGPAIIKGQWTHVVGTFAPTGVEIGGALVGVKSLYVNGDLVATGTQRFAPNEWKPLRIGAGLTETPTAQPLAGFVGRIAEVAVYDRPLDKDRIVAHWEASKYSDTTEDTTP